MKTTSVPRWLLAATLIAVSAAPSLAQDNGPAAIGSANAEARIAAERKIKELKAELLRLRQQVEALGKEQDAVSGREPRLWDDRVSRRDRDVRREAVIRRFDKDGDGVLSSEERVSMNDVHRRIVDGRQPGVGG